MSVFCVRLQSNTLVWANQRSFFENVTVCSNRTLKKTTCRNTALVSNFLFGFTWSVCCCDAFLQSERGLVKLFVPIELTNSDISSYSVSNILTPLDFTERKSFWRLAKLPSVLSPSLEINDDVEGHSGPPWTPVTRPKSPILTVPSLEKKMLLGFKSLKWKN